MVELATRLDRSRWSPAVVCLGPRGPLAEPLENAGIRVESLSVNPRNPVGAVIRLARVLRHQRPALVQSFLFHANVASRLAGQFCGRPWLLGGIRVAERRKGWHLRLERATCRLATGAVCVSEGVREFMIGPGGWSPDRLTVIPNGIDVARYSDIQPLDRSAWTSGPPGSLALFVGRLDEQKDVPTLLDAARTVAMARPDWRLLLVGDGPERRTLWQQIESDPVLARAVVPLGFRTDVPRLLATADLLVLPSRWEGMPNVVLEAMASGRPVVATDVEGTREVVEPGKTGWLVQPGAGPALASALLDAASDPDRLGRYGRAARRAVEERYGIEGVVATYDRLWSSVLGLD